MVGRVRCRVISLIAARLIIASELSGSRSWPLTRRRACITQAHDRSMARRRGRTTKPLASVGFLVGVESRSRSGSARRAGRPIDCTAFPSAAQAFDLHGRGRRMPWSGLRGGAAQTLRSGRWAGGDRVVGGGRWAARHSVRVASWPVPWGW